MSKDSTEASLALLSGQLPEVTPRWVRLAGARLKVGAEAEQTSRAGLTEEEKAQAATDQRLCVSAFQSLRRALESALTAGRAHRVVSKTDEKRLSSQLRDP